MNNKEHKEFTPEELEEIRAYAEQEAAAPDEYRFSNPDPYAKPEPAPEGQPRRFWFDAEGHIRVKNLSAFWLPELTLQREIGGTVYSVTGSYEGTETLDRKLKRNMEQNAGEMEGQA